MIKIGKLFFLTLFLPVFAFAKVEVRATVNRNPVPLGQPFNLNVEASSDQSADFGQPGLPVIENVQLLNSYISSQSNSTVQNTGHGIDFITIRKKIYHYQFVAEKEGTVRIDPIQVTVDGKAYRTQPIEVRVVKSGGLAQGRGQFDDDEEDSPFGRDPLDEFEERFNQLLNRQFGGVPGAGGFMTAPRNSKEAFFILAEVDKTQAYKGEQITASWYLYTQGRVRDLDTLKYPTLKGFWKEDIQISTQLNFEQDVVNGVPYSRALLASYALFPIEEGKQTVDPYKAKATIVGGFGFGQGFKATKASDNIPILVKPLPEEGKPADFTGAVGEFQMMVDAPNKTIVTHQPFELRVRFEGRGNAKLIELPQLPLGDKLEIYDISNESQFFKNGQSFKEFEVLLIPKEAGELVIAPLKSSFFNPAKGEYVSLQSEPIRLQVLPGSKQESIGEERLKSDEKKKVLPPIASDWDPNFKASSSKKFIWPFVYILLFMALITKAILDSGYFNKKPSIEEVIGLRFQRIDKMVSKDQLRKASIEATNTVYQVLGDLSGEGGASEEFEKMLSKLAPSVRREIEVPLHKLMDYFGVLGFGPKSYVKSFSDKKGLKEKASELKTILLKACKISKGTETND